mmetsp:Transcript_6929/g.16970  ORF Transcript_6929/g.16970 Transcript_6929/m.16970 type:complete len:206 (+) Transcript_6929:637-1254(+)
MPMAGSLSSRPMYFLKVASSVSSIDTNETSTSLESLAASVMTSRRSAGSSPSERMSTMDAPASTKFCAFMRPSAWTSGVISFVTAFSTASNPSASMFPTTGVSAPITTTSPAFTFTPSTSSPAATWKNLARLSPSVVRAPFAAFSKAFAASSASVTATTSFAAGAASLASARAAVSAAASSTEVVATRVWSWIKATMASLVRPPL